MRQALKSALLRSGIFPTTIIFRLREYLRSRGAASIPQDSGVSLPSPYLMVLVAGSADYGIFLQFGRDAASSFDELLRRHGASLVDRTSILDFGCGCGRIARHLPAHTNAAIHGVDYNKKLIGWCRENLRGTYSRNKLIPPVQIQDCTFDLVYAVSVFTHLRERTQFLWLEELKRITMPGGYVIITFHDETYLPHLKDTVTTAGFHIMNDAIEGSNFISAYQSLAYVRREYGRFFDVLEVVPSGSRLHQAAVLLRRPTTSAIGDANI